MIPLTHFSLAQIQAMESRYRAAMINSLSGFKGVVLIGTQDPQGQTNLAIFSSLFHLGSSPALFGHIIRPDTVYRHTLDNIMHTGVYTINHLNASIYKQAHQTSARYEHSVSEFTATGLETEYSQGIVAPYVRESSLKFGMKFEERIDLKINGTILIIGSVVETFIPSDSIAGDGYVDIEKAGTVTVSGLDSYHFTERLARLTYAKPDSFTRELGQPAEL